ncbi:NUDIX hydrolase [Nocardioides marinquilinus]|uniref:NUDIX hydrolase n=1 Tax=Nocardioides marinquilinus TaxID=1210400 RepID=UPI0031E778F2
MQAPRLRPSARALLLDADDRLLLARHDLTERHLGRVVWAPPGGGIEPGETPLDAVVRELAEEVGVHVAPDVPVHVWHQEVVSPTYAAGWDGAVLDFFVVRWDADAVPLGTTEALLADEGITDFRWWTADEVAAVDDDGLLRPRHLPALLPALLAGGYDVSGPIDI